jgi:DNA-binding MarR family transcriptional regulator
LSNSNAPILTPIQVKILLAMLRAKDHSLNSEAILRETGIALSTWSAEQGKLVDMGVIQKRLVRVLTNDSISKRMNYTLTEKGVEIALNLLNISKILSSSKDARVNNRPSSEAEEFSEIISECIEVGLESFGANFVMLVKTTLESDKSIPWSIVPEKPKELLQVCRELFGQEAAKKLETVIVRNIASRFARSDLCEKDLESTITLSKVSFSKNNGVADRDQKVIGDPRVRT